MLVASAAALTAITVGSFQVSRAEDSGRDLDAATILVVPIRHAIESRHHSCDWRKYQLRNSCDNPVRIPRL